MTFEVQHTHHIQPESADFALHLDACINAISQDDATGTTIAFLRQNGQLYAIGIDALAISAIDLERYEMLLFDGGNSHGDSWKHLFFPKYGLHCFIDETT